MATQASPVTPDVVRWAVAEDGRDAPQLAEALDIDEETLRAWADGAAKPSKGQVTKLADLLKRPRALFFLPAPPESATLPQGFRHPPGSERDVSQAARLQLRRARRVQSAVAWALRDEEPVRIPRHRLAQDPEVVAQLIRTWSGITARDQAAWRGDYPSLNGWRQALDDLGLLVFSIEIGRDDVRGFSSWDPQAPLLAVNVSGVSPPARIFTLAHELGHLVTRTDAACIEPQALLVDVDVERWCERFAAAFLMPAADVRAMARVRGLGLGEASIDDVRALSDRFQVSARAAALRLIGLGYAPVEFYAAVEAVFRPSPPPPADPEKKRRGNTPRHVRREREFGPRALREVLNRLPEHDALRVLRMTVQDARIIAERVPGIDVTL